MVGGVAAEASGWVCVGVKEDWVAIGVEGGIVGDDRKESGSRGW